MKNVDIQCEVTLRNKVKSLARENNFKVYIVGSQLDESVKSKDLNIIAVMDDDVFKNNFEMSFSEINEHFKNSDYNNMGMIKYICVVKKIEVDLKFTTMMNINFKLVDFSGFNFKLPYKRIDNINV